MRDKFRNRPATRASKINAVLGINPKTTKQIERESGCKAVYEHLLSLLKQGYVEKTKTGKEVFWSLPVPDRNGGKNGTRLMSLTTEALQLSTHERGELATRLLDSLEPEPEEGVEEAWAKEIKARLDDYRSGKVKAIPGPEALRLIFSDDDVD